MTEQTAFADTISQGCPEGDACDECGHCVHSWHTGPITRYTVDKILGLKSSVIMRYCDVCDCEVQLSPDEENGLG